MKLTSTQSLNRVTAPRRRTAFTLTELLVVIALLVTLASMALFALWGVTEEAKARRTRSIIGKIDLLIHDKWDSYATRRVVLASTAGLNNGPKRAFARVAAIRELQRMELPERKTDLTAGAFVVANPPSAFLGYLRRCRRPEYLGEASPGVPDWSRWTVQYQGSECLHLILAGLSDGDKSGLDILRPEETGDLDNDGMPEVLDAWRRPIDFIRWPAGYLANPELAWLQDDATLSIPPASCNAGPVVPVATEQNAFFHTSLAPNVPLTPAPDRFDPLRSDPRWRDTDDPAAGTAAEPEHGRVNNPYDLRPLLLSAGPDRVKNVDFTLPDTSSGIPDTVNHAAVNVELQAIAAAQGRYAGLNVDYFRNDPYRFFHIQEDCSGTPTDLTLQIGTPRGEPALDNLTNHNLEAQ